MRCCSSSAISRLKPCSIRWKRFSAAGKLRKPAALKWPAPPQSFGPAGPSGSLPGTVQTQIVLGNIGITRRDPDWYRVVLANSIYGGAFHSRLVINIREQKGYTYSPRSGNNALREYGYFTVHAAVRNEVVAATLTEMFYEMDRMRSLAGDRGGTRKRPQLSQRGVFARRRHAGWRPRPTLDGLSRTLAGRLSGDLSRAHSRTHRSGHHRRRPPPFRFGRTRKSWSWETATKSPNKPPCSGTSPNTRRRDKKSSRESACKSARLGMREPMPDQMETRSQADHGEWPNPLVNGSREGAPSASPRRPAHWILRNEKFVRAMCMVGLYVFGGIFLVSILAVGAFAPHQRGDRNSLSGVACDLLDAVDSQPPPAMKPAMKREVSPFLAAGSSRSRIGSGRAGLLFRGAEA